MSITHIAQQVDIGSEDQVHKRIWVPKSFGMSCSLSLVGFRYQNTLQDLALCIIAKLLGGITLRNRSPSSSLTLSLLGYNLFSIASTELIEMVHDLSVARLFITAASQRVSVCSAELIIDNIPTGT